MSITPAIPAGHVSLDNQPPPAPLPTRASGGGENERTGFGDPFAVRLSAEEGSADPRDPTGAIADRLRGFREEVQKMLVQRGMDIGEAADAAAVLASAVGVAASRPEIRDELADLVERGGASLASRAALVIEEAVIRWDPLSQRFVPSVQRVAVSVDVENGYVVPRGAEPDLADPARRIAVLRLDAALPLGPGA
ncbi:MAG: hypothetical protein ACK4QW_09675 [Alphaproteobacteria bacterium]